MASRENSKSPRREQNDFPFCIEGYTEVASGSQELHAVIRSPSEEEVSPGYDDLLDKSPKIRAQYELMMPAIEVFKIGSQELHAVIRSPSEEEFAPGNNDLLDKSLKIRAQYELMMPARVQVQVWWSRPIPLTSYFTPPETLFILKEPERDLIQVVNPISRRHVELEIRRTIGFKLIGHSTNGWLLFLNVGSREIFYYNIINCLLSVLPPVPWEVQNPLSVFTTDLPQVPLGDHFTIVAPSNRTFLVEFRGETAELLQYSVEKGWTRCSYNIDDEAPNPNIVGIEIMPGGRHDLVVLDSQNLLLHFFSTNFDRRYYWTHRIPLAFQMNLAHSPCSLIRNGEAIYILHGDDAKLVRINTDALVAEDFLVEADLGERVIYAINRIYGECRNARYTMERKRIFIAGIDRRREISRANTRFRPSMYHGVSSCIRRICKCNYGIVEL